jgi:hypothetical protein
MATSTTASRSSPSSARRPAAVRRPACAGLIYSSSTAHDLTHNHADQPSRLEAQLRERLRAIRDMQGPSAAGAHGAAALALDAHRRVFERFLQGAPTYRPLLLRVKAAYDPALRDALGSIYDHVHLKGQLAEAPARAVSLVACLWFWLREQLGGYRADGNQHPSSAPR